MTAFAATMEHTTKEWQLNNTVGEWYCIERRNAGSRVVFGEVGGSYSDNKADFVCSEGLHFCEKSEEAYRKGAKIQHVAILMVSYY